MGKRTALKVIKAIEQAEGDGARVRRSIGGRAHYHFNPFLMLDHFKSKATAGFPQHPHRGQETITYLIEGAVAHEDFTGSKGILLPGDLQFMTAGRGVVHSEMPVNLDGNTEQMIEGMQLWVDLPQKLRFTEPRYRDLRNYEIPVVVEDEGKVEVKVISGEAYGVKSAQDLAYTPVEYYAATIKPNGTYKQKVTTDFNFFLYVLKGDVVVNDDIEVPQFHNVLFNRDGDEVVVENRGTEDAGLVLIGGKVLDQKTVQYGPFVGDSEAALRQAFSDYQYAKNGFENLRTWDSLISGGVTKDMIEILGGSPEKRKEDERKFLEAKKQQSIAVNDEL